MLIVAGAGNGGQIGNGANFVYPAAERFNSDDNVFSVGASTRYERLATFSTMGNAGSGDARWVRFVAPGENIVSALQAGDAAFGRVPPWLRQLSPASWGSWFPSIKE